MTNTAFAPLNKLKLSGACRLAGASSGREIRALPARATLRLEPGARRLLCTSGRVWVTFEGSSADMILRAASRSTCPPVAGS